MNQKYLVSLLALVFLSLSCGSSVAYRKPADDEGSRQWGPREVRETSIRIVESMYRYLKDNNIKAFIALKKIRNRTSEHIDTQMLADEIISALVKRKIRFIDISARDDSLKEIEFSQTGVTEDSLNAGALKSPNFFLTGTITENMRSVDGKNVQYLVVTFRLTDVETTEIKWQDQKKFLKVSDQEKLSW